MKQSPNTLLPTAKLTSTWGGLTPKASRPFVFADIYRTAAGVADLIDVAVALRLIRSIDGIVCHCGASGSVFQPADGGALSMARVEIKNSLQLCTLRITGV
jgi:hypothetical protein